MPDVAGLSGAATVADTIRVFESWMPRALVGRPAVDRLLSIASHFPAAITDWIYFECRLSPPASAVDLIFRIDRRGRAILTGENPALRLADALVDDPIWTRVLAFAVEWSRETPPLRDVVHQVWLEFDAPPDSNATPIPGVFVDFIPGSNISAVIEVLDAMRGCRATPDVIATLSRCIARLPARAHVGSIGWFPGRGSDAIRVCFVNVLASHLFAWLKASGWSGSYAELGDVMGVAAASVGGPNAAVGMVHLDIGAGVEPVIGLEFPFARASQLQGRLTEQSLLDALVDGALCSRGVRDALNAWPGHTIATLPHELWPSLVRRQLNHIKVTVAPNRPVTAKAYLCASHRYWRRSTLHGGRARGRADGGQVAVAV